MNCQTCLVEVEIVIVYYHGLMVMVYLCDVGSGQRLSLENRDDRTIVTLSTYAPGQQQQSSYSLTTGNWTAPPEVRQTEQGIIGRLAIAAGDRFLHIQGSSLSFVNTADGFSTGRSLEVWEQPISGQTAREPTAREPTASEPFTTQTTNRQPPETSLPPMPPMQMGNMQMSLNPMEMRMGNMEMRMGSATGDRQFCSQCGATLKPDDRFCSRCGHKLSD